MQPSKSRLAANTQDNTACPSPRIIRISHAPLPLRLTHTRRSSTLPSQTTLPLLSFLSSPSSPLLSLLSLPPLPLPVSTPILSPLHPQSFRRHSFIHSFIHPPPSPYPAPLPPGCVKRHTCAQPRLPDGLPARKLAWKAGTELPLAVGDGAVMLWFRCFVVGLLGGGGFKGCGCWWDGIWFGLV